MPFEGGSQAVLLYVVPFVFVAALWLLAYAAQREQPTRQQLDVGIHLDEVDARLAGSPVPRPPM
jgi:hypothetical protein